MAAVRRVGTTPEVIVRAALTEIGLVYRCNVRSLPGSPDMANKRRKIAVFVHGCFWHRHPRCLRSSMPKSNRQFWLRKFRDNIRRDARNLARLRDLGYRVAVIWECDTTDFRRVVDYLRFQLNLPEAR